ncbi:4a-hydroxytetrahydrobiopterin dehydratase [Aporhodopirellula aestuarii]|uniref:4a-hydroxytetrahydrobiopterin dehydratase n=1 Tax=Aporhodopirellula aestuarii TaxID=2950107 RepID=A0ABT0U997_9BACT|nr:4a-hydroxytetrahydrobiopterin dehydratase [Aporhodopirellula aestuarii]MCM2372983.1 4a-hydroxytetrahydrobiopterin dehydratase [Aporhodopirellula aestuarii]
MNSSANPNPDDAHPGCDLRDSLVQGRCVPCEGGVEPIAGEQAQQYVQALTDWNLDETGTQISRKINTKNFARAVTLINQIADLAEEQAHHPDLHLTGYRHLQIVLSTHAIGGLSENDFIIAAKIDELLK